MNNAPRKAELAAILDRQRPAIGHAFAGIRHEANLSRKARESVRQHTSVWIAGAAVFGWILSRLPARKKKIYVDNNAGAARTARRGAGVALALAALKIAGNLAKPAITAFATKKVADMLALTSKVQKRAIQRQ